MRIVMEVAKDMTAFTFIAAIIILSFSLIFKIYDEKDTFGGSFVLTYRSIFGDFDTTGFGTVQYIMFVISTLMLDVILLQLLVAIMEDTFEKVQDTAIPADSIEKLAMILETLQEMRTIMKVCCRRKERKRNQAGENRGFLFRVAASKGISDTEQLEEEEEQPFEGKIHTLKKQMKATSSYLKSQMLVRKVQLFFEVVQFLLEIR